MGGVWGCHKSCDVWQSYKWRVAPLFPMPHSPIDALCLISISLWELYNDLSALAHVLCPHTLSVSGPLFFTHLYRPTWEIPSRAVCLSESTLKDSALPPHRPGNLSRSCLPERPLHSLNPLPIYFMHCSQENPASAFLVFVYISTFYVCLSLPSKLLGSSPLSHNSPSLTSSTSVAFSSSRAFTFLLPHVPRVHRISLPCPGRTGRGLLRSYSWCWGWVEPKECGQKTGTPASGLGHELFHMQ